MSKETNPTNPTKSATRTRRKWTPAPNFSAQEKAQAVLAVWTEKASAAAVSRELGVNQISFAQWQKRAMEGMLQALESRLNLAGGAALSPRLQLLLARQQQAPMMSRLTARLEKIQAAKPEAGKPKS